VIVTTDASEWGWGAWTAPDGETISTFGRYPQAVAEQSSNFRELTAIIMAILAFNSILKGKTVQIVSDNTTAISCINKLRSTSQNLNDLTTYLVRLCLQLDIKVSAVHIQGEQNKLADYLSRFSETADWATEWEIFQHLDQLWGRHTIDRFASWTNKKVERYNSATLDSQAELVDAFSAPTWRTTPDQIQPPFKENNYINPPFHLLEQVVNKIIQDKATATLIIPMWTQHQWYRKAIQHAKSIIDLSSHQNIFRSGLYGNTKKIGPPSWKVLACRFFWNN
jgi:hypothetical protein